MTFSVFDETADKAYSLVENIILRMKYTNAMYCGTFSFCGHSVVGNLWLIINGEDFFCLICEIFFETLKFIKKGPKWPQRLWKINSREIIYDSCHSIWFIQSPNLIVGENAYLRFPVSWLILAASYIFLEIFSNKYNESGGPVTLLQLIWRTNRILAFFLYIMV